MNFQVRRLLERLVKKFGFDIVQKFVPEKSPIAKMLANAKKVQRRNQKQREEAARTQGDSDESDDEDIKDSFSLFFKFSKILV